MKKIVLFILVTWTYSVSAQIKWGGVLGFQSSDIGNMDLVTTSRQGNLLAGIMADYHIGKSGFYILGQLQYAPMGYSESNLSAVNKEGTIIGIIDSHRIGYIRVPLYFLFKQENKKAKIGAGLGPVISFQTNDKIKIKGGDTFGNGVVLPGNVKGFVTYHLLKKINDLLSRCNRFFLMPGSYKKQTSFSRMH